MKLAPIVLFVFKRPDHTMRTLDALQKNDLASDSVLYVYQDGPGENASAADLQKMNDVTKIFKDLNGFRKVVFTKRERNLGLASNVIDGITEVVRKHQKVIVLEDDILTSRYFLKYLNDGLELYEDMKNVYAVNSYMFPIATEEATTFLSPLATSTWGWATWADRWACFEIVPENKKMIQQNKFLRARFNLADYNYADMLNNQNSWGIRWYYSVFMRNGLGLFPTRTLSVNIGFDNEATHTRSELKQMELFTEMIELEKQDQINLNFHRLLLDYFSVPEKPKNKPDASQILKKKLHRAKKKILSFLMIRLPS